MLGRKPTSQRLDRERRGAVSRRLARLAVGWVALVSAAAMPAAEIELRSDCRTEGGLVLLGDIAAITSDDPSETKRLAALDITAAPPAGQKRYIRARELQDLLATRGVNWRRHRLSGANQVTIVGALDRPTKPSTTVKPVRPQAVVVNSRQATESATKQLRDYVQECTASEADYQVKFELSTEQAQFIMEAGEQLVVTGGKDPWTGPQQFLLSATLHGEFKQTTVRATVTLPPMLVVANRTIPRGAIIREGDVRTQPGSSPNANSQTFQSVDDVIGKEAPRGLVEGQILDHLSARSPLLVRRGEIVTVFARCGGVQVRTTARAREEGSHNDLVPVETLADRKVFFTRVIGVQEVEVFAHAVSVPGESTESRAAALAAKKPAAPEAPLPPRSADSEFATEDPRTTSTPQIELVNAVAPTPPRTPASTPAPGSILAQMPTAGPNSGIKSVVVPKPRPKNVKLPGKSNDDAGQ